MAKRKKTAETEGVETPSTTVRGILLLCFGNASYAYATWNIIASIRYFNKDINITVCFDESTLKHIPPIENINTILLTKEQTHNSKGKLEPGKVKTLIYDLSTYDETLYIDVDSILLKDITPLMELLSNKDGYFYTTVIDKGGRDANLLYNGWADMAHIWEYFTLKSNAILPTIQSSYCWFRKCDEAKEFFNAVKKNFYIPYQYLKTRWGGTIPDELIYSGTCAQFGIIPDGDDAVFFGNKTSHETFEQITEKHYIHTLYGSGRGQKTVRLKYIEWYDRLMNKYAGRNYYKAQYIMRGKHVDNH